MSLLTTRPPRAGRVTARVWRAHRPLIWAPRRRRPLRRAAPLAPFCRLSAPPPPRRDASTPRRAPAFKPRGLLAHPLPARAPRPPQLVLHLAAAAAAPPPPPGAHLGRLGAEAAPPATRARAAAAAHAPAAPAALRAPAAWVDIDAPDAGDPLAAAPYAEAIFCHLRAAERLRRPGVHYMEAVQADVNPAMRAILVDWLVEVGQEYRLTSDTLFLAVAYVDRFLSLRAVPRARLQLVGVAATLVAAKFEEIYAPQVDELVYITDSTYARAEVLGLERELLGALAFDLSQPTAKTFLRRFVKAAAAEARLDGTFEHLAGYLAELSLLDYGALHFLPSAVAAAAVLLALHYLGAPRWSPTLERYSGYAPADLAAPAAALHALFLGARASALPASRDKFGGARYGGVSGLRAPRELPAWLFQ